MNLFHALRERAHPLHRLRKFKFFQAIPRYFDPAIMWRLPHLPKSICLRLISNASLMFAAEPQEESVHHTFMVVLQALPRDGAFWDVGANIGWFTWYCASIYPDFEIVSFEPDSKNRECLDRTSRAWNLPRHTIVPRAVAESAGTAVFLIDDLSGATGALEDTTKTFNQFHYGRSSRRIEVEIISLDDFMMTRMTRPSIVKIDVEGAEFRVLQGAVNLIRQFQSILFFETFSHREEVMNFLSPLGYQFYDSDRRQVPTNETVNFMAIVPQRWPSVASALRGLGYPISLP